MSFRNNIKRCVTVVIVQHVPVYEGPDFLESMSLETVHPKIFSTVYAMFLFYIFMIAMLFVNNHRYFIVQN